MTTDIEIRYPSDGVKVIPLKCTFFMSPFRGLNVFDFGKSPLSFMFGPEGSTVSTGWTRPAPANNRKISQYHRPLKGSMVNMQDFLQVFQESGIGKMEDNLTSAETHYLYN